MHHWFTLLSSTRKMSDAWLDTIEQRLEILENGVFGNGDKDAEYPKFYQREHVLMEFHPVSTRAMPVEVLQNDADKVIDTLAHLHGQVNSALAGRNKIEHLMKRLPELEKYVDPAYSDELTLSQGAKAEIILAEEELLRAQSTNLQKVEEMMPILNSEHIKVVPSLQGQLQALSTVHLKQQDDASDVTEDIKDLLLYYNNVVALLSKQFVQWDEILTNLEIAAQNKNIDE